MEMEALVTALDEVAMQYSTGAVLECLFLAGLILVVRWIFNRFKQDELERDSALVEKLVAAFGQASEEDENK